MTPKRDSNEMAYGPPGQQSISITSSINEQNITNTPCTDTGNVTKGDQYQNPSNQFWNNGNRQRKRKRKERVPDPVIKCGICNVNDSKYKCPKCRVFRYCSVDCYRNHKENPEECVAPDKKPKYNANEPVSVTGYTVSDIQYK